MPRPYNSLVGNNQNVFRAELAGELAQPPQRAATKNDARAGLKIERQHTLMGTCRNVLKSRSLNGTAPIQELKHVPLVRLVP